MTDLHLKKIVSPIDESSRVGGHQVPKDGSVAMLQQDAQTSPEVAERFFNLLASVAGQSRGYLPHLHHCHWVPAPQGLSCHRQEADTLPPAVLLCPSHLFWKAKLRAWPGVVAASATGNPWKVFTTVTFKAPSFSPHNVG